MVLSTIKSHLWIERNPEKFEVSLALSLYMRQEHLLYNTLDGALAIIEKLEIPG